MRASDFGMLLLARFRAKEISHLCQSVLATLALQPEQVHRIGKKWHTCKSGLLSINGSKITLYRVALTKGQQWEKDGGRGKSEAREITHDIYLSIDCHGIVSQSRVNRV